MCQVHGKAISCRLNKWMQVNVMFLSDMCVWEREREMEALNPPCMDAAVLTVILLLTSCIFNQPVLTAAFSSWGRPLIKEIPSVAAGKAFQLSVARPPPPSCTSHRIQMLDKYTWVLALAEEKLEIWGIFLSVMVSLTGWFPIRFHGNNSLDLITFSASCPKAPSLFRCGLTLRLWDLCFKLDDGFKSKEV